MIPSQSSVIRPMRYPAKTWMRAERALRCSPFKLPLFTTMRWQSVSLNAIAQAQGVRNQYTVRPLPELKVEDEMLWLIQVGLLRREVDGQGLTDSFRLTPLGRQLVETWQPQGGLGHPSWLDWLYNFLSRWFRRPSWLQ